MSRRDVDNAILRAFGEGEAEASAPRQGGEASEQADRVERACRGLQQLATGLSDPQPPAGLRERVLRAASAPRPARTWRLAWVAAAAAVLAGVVAWGLLTRPRRMIPPGDGQTPPVPVAVYDDEALDRMLAEATEMAEEISTTFAGPESWWDQQIESIQQDIETLGGEVTDPTATRPGGTLATTHPA